MKFVVFLAAALACGPALADDGATAREHFRHGTSAFNLGHYLEAVAEYEAAYEAKPDPVLLYNIAQAYRLAGENRSAVRVYKSFLHQLPEAPQRAEVERRIAELQQAMENEERAKAKAAADAEAARASKAVVQAPVAPPAAQPADKAPAWYQDRTAMALGIVGVAALGAGVGLAVMGSQNLSDAPNAPDLQDHDNLRSRGIALEAAGYASLGVGAALCIGAAIKWSVRPKHARTAWNVGVGTNGIRVGGSF
jgi:tetratricopeptide (TPR) repeat protein